MEVYIEYVLLDNLIINAMILYFSMLIQKKRIDKKRLILTDLIATLASVISPLIQFSTIGMLIIKLVLGTILIAILSKYRTPKEYVLTYFLFLTITFLFGGVCYGIITMLGLKTSMSGVLIFGFEFPMSIILLLVYLYSYILYKVILHMKKQKVVDQFYYDIILYKNNEKVMCKGFLDTGNQVVSKNRQALLIVGMSTFCKLYQNIDYMKLCQGKVTLEDSYYMDIKAVGSTSKMLVTKIDKMEIYTDKKVTTFENKEIGLAMTNFHEFDCILGKSDILALEGDFL